MLWGFRVLIVLDLSLDSPIRQLFDFLIFLLGFVGNRVDYWKWRLHDIRILLMVGGYFSNALIVGLNYNMQELKKISYVSK
jgi:hypothetical protein